METQYAGTTNIDRQRLIERYLPLVRRVASSVGNPGATPTVSFDDLVSSGTVGLIEAVDRFDWARDTPFHVFAVLRIRGAMLDMLRELDGVPRGLRRRSRDLEAARENLVGQLAREPSLQELRCAVGWSPAQYDRVVNGTRRIGVPLDDGRVGEDFDGGGLTDTIADPENAELSERLEKSQLMESLGNALQRLPARDRSVIRLLFFERKPVGEVADAMSLSTTRIFQLRKRSLGRLRDDLSDQRSA